MWGIFRNRNNTYVGWILVRPKDFFSARPDWQALELGRRLKRIFWGQDLATEAARHLMAEFRKRRYQRFGAEANPENNCSINIMLKLGMRFQAQIHYDRADGNGWMATHLANSDRPNLSLPVARQNQQSDLCVWLQ